MRFCSMAQTVAANTQAVYSQQQADEESSDAVSCPKCSSEKILDLDRTLSIQAALRHHTAQCLNCGAVFTYVSGSLPK